MYEFLWMNLWPRQTCGPQSAGLPRMRKRYVLADSAVRVQTLEQRTLIAAGYTKLAGPNPVAGDLFGNGWATMLSNGNVVIVVSGDRSVADSVGAVCLYGSVDDHLIRTLKGSTTGDQVGSSRFAVLQNASFAVIIPNWYNNSVTDPGAVTWVNGTQTAQSHRILWIHRRTARH